MKSKIDSNEVTTNDMRIELKTFVASEIKNIPQYMELLDNKQKLDVLLKLMPFVFPKVESVTHRQGENWKIEL